MKKFIACGILVLCVGCATRSVPPQQLPPPPPPPPQAPVTPMVEPPIQPPFNPNNYTHAYRRGYNDGYAGNWLAPINWTLLNEYRAGWSAGNRDRQAGLSNKFDRA